MESTKDLQKKVAKTSNKATLTSTVSTRSSVEIFDIKDLKYFTHGESTKPVLFMVHGLKSAAATFFSIVDDLKDLFFLIIIDQRGHGGSKEAKYDYSLDSMANDIKVILDYLNITEPIYLLGHSYGGRTAMRFCELFPKMVKKLIIEDMEFLKRKSDSVIEAKRTADIYRKDIPLEYRSEAAFLATLGKIYGKSEALGFLSRRSIIYGDGSIYLLFKPWVSCLYAHFSASADFEKFLKSTNIPILVIGAEKGSSISQKGYKQLALGKNLIYKEIAGAEHNVHGSQKILFLNELINFLTV